MRYIKLSIKWSKTQNSFFAMDYFWRLSFWEFFSIWQLWIPKKCLFFLHGDIHDLWRCERCIHTQPESPQWFIPADNGSLTLACVYWGGLYRGCSFLCEALRMFLSLVRVQRKRWGAADKLSETLSQHHVSDYLILRPGKCFSGIIAHNRDAWLGLCVVFENDEWWNLPAPSTITA